MTASFDAATLAALATVATPDEITQLQAALAELNTGHAPAWLFGLMVEIVQRLAATSAKTHHTSHHLPACGTLYRGCAPDCPKRLSEIGRM